MPSAVPALRSVFYVSRPASGLGRLDVQQILQLSRRNNRRADVTGCLLVTADAFGQALEGTPDALAATLARIRADRRHHDVRMLSDTAVSRRRFGDWSMGHIHAEALAHRIGALFKDGDMQAQVDRLLDDVQAESIFGYAD